MSMRDWHSSLSFGDRLVYVTRIQTAIQSTGTLDFTQSTIRARELETKAYERSVSKHQYEQEVASYVQISQPQPVTPPASDAADIDEFTEAGVTIGDYVNATFHKSGVASTVYKARSPAPTTGTLSPGLVALKVTERADPPHDSRREVQLLTAAAHRHVLPLLGTLIDRESRFVLVFPFFRYDLAHVLRHQVLTGQQSRSVLSDLMSALSHIHSLGIIHRDIKPSNILMHDINGPAVLADFGISWKEGVASSESPSEKILDIGSTCYRPPELLFGNRSYDESVDIWAAGCVAAQTTSLGQRTLFDSGDLGSDLFLVKSIFETLGTPDLATWPEAKDFPDWGRMAWKVYPARPWHEILPRASAEARDLVSSLVRYESGSRLRAQVALTHPYFNTP